MKGYILIYCLMVMFYPGSVFSQESNENDLTVPESAEEKNKQKSKNANIDAKMLYGQYNNILWSGSIIQNFKHFTYQLNSDLKRSNDFGYKNSSFYENEIGFTGKAEFNDTWELTPQVEVNNESHGMLRNPVYSREEKDKVILEFKNEYKPMPTRWYLNFGGAYYIHRLDSALSTAVTSSNFYKVNAELAWEYIWSAANKLRLDSKFSQYFYSTGSDHDTFVSNEFIWSFKITEYVMVSLGPVYKYNRDGGHFISGRADLSTASLKYVLVELSYVYDLVPFLPENFYFEKKYMKPYYSLPPSRGHNASLKIGIDINNNSKKKFYVKKVKIKAAGSYETNDKFYNCFSLNYFSIPENIPENVLSALPMQVMFCRAKGDTAIGFSIFTSYLELGVNYEYFYFYASKNVTYQPEHSIGGYLRFNLYRLDVECNNRLKGDIFVDPYNHIKLKRLLLGSLSVQFRVMKTFFLYAKVDNIYNSKYSLIYGYQEPGRTIIGGLRIII